MAHGSRNDNTGAVLSALSNPLILEHIFQYVPLSDLQCLCFVSKDWYSCTAKSFKKYSYVKLDDKKKVLQFIAHLKSAGDDKIWDRYVNIIFEYIRFSKFTPTQTFWNTLGHQIRILNLKDCTFPKRDALRKIMYQTCPNLKELRVEQIAIREKRDVSKMQVVASNEITFEPHSNLKCLMLETTLKKSGISWMEVLSHFPSIQIFRFCSRNQLAKERDAKIYQAILDIRRQDPAKLKLKEICLIRYSGWDSESSIPLPLLQLLTDPCLQFEKIAISLHRSRNKTLLEQILSQQSESLNTLELDGRECKVMVQPRNCFPPTGLQNLTELILCSGVFTTLEFLQFTPNLKKMSLQERHGTTLAGTSISDAETWTHQGCRELEVFDLVSLEELGKLVKILPNVDRLKMSLDYDTLEMVCLQWKNLSSLMLLNCAVDDHGIVAFDFEMEPVRSGGKVSVMVKDGTPPVPNITSLKDLRRLSLMCVEGRRAISSRKRAYFHCFDDEDLGDDVDVSVYSAIRFGLQPKEFWSNLDADQFDFSRRFSWFDDTVPFLLEYNFS